MATTAHFIDVGQGNMTLLSLANGTVMLYDCNVTSENQNRVISYMSGVLPKRKIDIFVNSHRDADHMRGVLTVHRYFPIGTVWDSGVTGTSPECDEYREYMQLRRSVGYRTVDAFTFFEYGSTKVRVFNAKNDELTSDANAQSIVLKIEHRGATGNVLSSLMLAGDSDAPAWRKSMMPYYGVGVSSSILLASHHGSLSFFDDPDDSKFYYTEHLKTIKPYMTIISVGPNQHGHPEDKALEFYTANSIGSDKGNKVFRTDKQGTMKLVLKDEGGWTLTPNQKIAVPARFSH